MMRTSTRRRLRHAMRPAIALTAVLVADSSLADAPTVFRQLAEARHFSDSLTQGGPTRLDFKFDDGRALLRKDGTWRVEAVIRHGGLRCGTYRLGIRFGSGKPGCLDVTWISEPVFATALKHCNNAERPHQGNGHDPLLSEAFDEISCAERVIRCTGLCSARSPDQSESLKQFGD